MLQIIIKLSFLPEDEDLFRKNPNFYILTHWYRLESIVSLKTGHFSSAVEILSNNEAASDAIYYGLLPPGPCCLSWPGSKCWWKCWCALSVAAILEPDVTTPQKYGIVAADLHS